MAQNTPTDEFEVLAQFKPDQIRNVMVYLGSDESVRQLMLNSGTITGEEACYLDSVVKIDNLKHAVMKRIFAVLKGETEEAA
jgi:hypothetical protein